MTTRRIALGVLLAVVLPLNAGAQTGDAQRPTRQGPPTPEQREAMRQRIEMRFLDMAAQRLELDANQRTRLGAVMQHTAGERRSIAEEGMRLRREAADLLRAGGSDGARAEHILTELTRLREREMDLWRREQRDLAGVLSPVQRLELMAMRARFSERVRGVRGMGPDGEGGRGHRDGGRRGVDGPGVRP
jgi:Spy/CpxP family protein refolding chaperone